MTLKTTTDIITGHTASAVHGTGTDTTTTGTGIHGHTLLGDTTDGTTRCTLMAGMTLGITEAGMTLGITDGGIILGTVILTITAAGMEDGILTAIITGITMNMEDMTDLANGMV